MFLEKLAVERLLVGHGSGPSRGSKDHVKLRALSLGRFPGDLKRVDSFAEQGLQRARVGGVVLRGKVRRAFAGIGADFRRVADKIGAGDLKPPFADIGALKASKFLLQFFGGGWFDGSAHWISLFL